MKIAPLANVKARLSEYVDACRESPVVVTRNGRAVAMLIPINDDDLDSAFLANNPRFMEIIRRSWQQVREGRGIPEEEFWRRAAATEDAVDKPPDNQTENKSKLQYRRRRSTSKSKPARKTRSKPHTA